MVLISGINRILPVPDKDVKWRKSLAALIECLRYLSYLSIG